MEPYEKVLDFWFGRKNKTQFRWVWFKKSKATDKKIKKRFEKILHAAKAGKLSSWEKTPEGTLALLIVLDQFSRNIYRGNKKSFESDKQSLAIARRGLAKGYDKKMSSVERMFFYLPLTHCENPKVQNQSVALFKKIRHTKQGKGPYKYAVLHKQVIDTYGRFPHRNKIVGRKSNKKELEYLSKPGAGF